MELPGEVQNLCRATTESSLRGSKWPNIALEAYQASSAASERVFSLLNNMFTKKQVSSLGDYIQGSLMLAVNQRQVG